MVALIFMGGSVVACTPNDTGMLQADPGDLTHPLAERAASDAELVAACGEVGPPDGAPFPRLPYLQRTTPTSVSVMWGEKVPVPRLVAVTTPDGELVAEATSRPDPVPAAGIVGTIARIDGLEPDTVYCYEVQAIEGAKSADGAPLLGRVGFKTAPKRGSGAPTRFAVLGDSGDGSADQLALVDSISTVGFDFLLHVGDIAYSTGTAAEFQAHYFDVYEDILMHFSMFPVAGNHEYRSGDAVAFRALFDLPNNERWYSFDWGDAHFIGLDTEQLGEAQDDWLERDLAANALPWTVVYLHKGPYSSGWHGSNAEVEERFVPRFERYGVDLVLSGHDHHYERTKPIGGVQYIVTGGGGAGTYPVEPADFSAFTEEVVEFVYVEIDGDVLSLHAIDASGKEFDQVVIEH